MKCIRTLLLLAILSSFGFGQGSQPQAGYAGTPKHDMSGSKKGAQELVKLQKSRDAAKASFEKHPKDASSIRAFVRANDQLAYKTMTADGLSSHERYSTALKLYRQSIKAEPKDPEANKWVNMIESIYKSMHRPIPK